MTRETNASTLSSATIREAVLEDYPQIAALQARTGIDTKSCEEWTSVWVDNPTYKKLDHWVMGWVAENTEHKVVGYIGNIPVTFNFKGRELLAASIHSMTVDAAYRGSAGFLLRRLLSQKTPEIILVTTCNDKSSRLGEALGPRVPTGNWSRSVFWITEYRGFLASVLKIKRFPKVLCYPTSAIMRVADELRNANSVRRLACGEIETCSGFDARFDVFWDELKRRYPDRLLSTRSSEILQWHFGHPLAKRRVWILTYGDGSRLTAYAVFCRQDNPTYGLKRVRLVDFQSVNGDTRVLAPMLAWAFTRCQEEGIHMLTAFGFRPEKQCVIDSLAPHRRQFPFWCYFYKAVNKALRVELQNPAVWDPSHFDGDATL